MTRTLSDLFKISILITFGMGFLYLEGCASAKRDYCADRVRLSEKTKFNSNEEKLLCGDPEFASWTDIPFSQMEFQLRSYFKTRGYYDPAFKLTDGGPAPEGKRLLVDSGAKSTVKALSFSGAPAGFFEAQYVGWKNQLIVPTTLDDIQNYALRRMKSMGYACARVNLKADVQTGIVDAELSPGELVNFPRPRFNRDPGLSTNVSERYDAFRIGDRYDERLLTLTSSLMESSGVVTRSTFIPECEKKPFSVTHRLNLGQPRLLRIAVGASTEEFPIGRLSWSNTRLGHNASTLMADLYFSQLNESARIAYDWHVFPNANRWFFKPEIDIRRVNEKHQKYLQAKVGAAAATSLDLGPISLLAQSGPAGSVEKKTLGAEIGWKRYLLWESQWNLNSHDYQLHANDPRDGYSVQLNTSSILKARTAGLGGNSLSLQASQLWNLGGFEPPQYVIGYRAGIQSVVGLKGDGLALPSNYYYWLGGERDIRGFGRQELPGTDGGALSAAFAGFEFRAPAWLPKGFDPLFFFDIGKIGRENLSLTSDVYYSPGIGLRWASPIGAIRTTIARGFTQDPKHPPHLQFFLSLGREF